MAPRSKRQKHLLALAAFKKADAELFEASDSPVHSDDSSTDSETDEDDSFIEGADEAALLSWSNLNGLPKGRALVYTGTSRTTLWRRRIEEKERSTFVANQKLQPITNFFKPKPVVAESELLNANIDDSDEDADEESDVDAEVKVCSAIIA